MCSHFTKSISSVAMLVFGIVPHSHLAFAQVYTLDDRLPQAEYALARKANLFLFV